jgi:hypothetical protein
MVFPIVEFYIEPMSKDSSSSYPDISDILARKAEARKDRAKLPFAEKIAVIERMRERDAPFRKAREARRAKEVKGSPD